MPRLCAGIDGPFKISVIKIQEKLFLSAVFIILADIHVPKQYGIRTIVFCYSLALQRQFCLVSTEKVAQVPFAPRQNTFQYA